MKSKSTRRVTPMWPVFLGLGLSVLVLGVFVVEFISLSQRETVSGPIAENLTADTYMDIVSPMLENVNLERGERLLQNHACAACHLGAAAENGLAPNFIGIADRAGDRRPPLQAEAYLYESIVHPEAYVLEGYTSQMPQHYGQLTPAEIGDMIAYLLTMTEQ